MITLRTLGAVGLVDGAGRDLDGLLRQPKRLAVLIYLASPAPGTWHRRDTLLGIFWPEFQTGQARTALRNALYIVRQEAGAVALLTRGDDDVSVDRLEVVSDVAILEEHARAGRFAECLALYQGEFLPGFFVDDASEFEQWVDGERHRVLGIVLDAASRLSIASESSGDLAGALAAQRRVVELQPEHEASVCRLMLLLERNGDRSGALAAFDRLERQLTARFDAVPAAETLRLVRAIRARASSPEAAVPDAHAVTAGAAAPDSATAREAPSPGGEHARATGLRRRGVLVSLLLLVAVAGSLVYRKRAAALGPPTLVILPMENATGDRGNDYIAEGVAADVAKRLSALPSVTIRSATRADWPTRIRDSVALIGPAFGARMVLRSRLTAVGDSLDIDAAVVDVATGFVRPVAGAHFAVGALSDAASKVAAAVAGTVFRVPVAETPRPGAVSADPESYRLTMLGWHQQLGPNNLDGARDLFLRATVADPANARAWSGLSSTWAAAAVNGQIPFDEGYTLAEAAATRALGLDSLEGTAWANLGVLHALRSRSLAAGQSYFDRAMKAEPANAEVFMVYSSALRFAWEWDRARDPARIARQLDPLSGYYVGHEANNAMCADRPEEALTLYRAQLMLEPANRGAHIGVARALARLGRYDEAIAQLRALGRARNDTALVAALANAHGATDYWALKHREGEDLLKTRLALAGKRWVAPFLIAVAEIGAGRIDDGMELLEAEVRAGSRMVYKLPCNPEIDEVRSLPRFQQLLKAAGPLPLTSGRQGT